MATATTDIVQKLWNLCTLLKEDGVTYHQYVTELTYLLFLKMMKEQKREDALPKGLRWDALTSKEGVEQLDFYKRLLLDMGEMVQDPAAGTAGFLIEADRYVKVKTDRLFDLKPSSRSSSGSAPSTAWSWSMRRAAWR